MSIEGDLDKLKKKYEKGKFDAGDLNKIRKLQKEIESNREELIKKDYNDSKTMYEMLENYASQIERAINAKISTLKSDPNKVMCAKCKEVVTLVDNTCPNCGVFLIRKSDVDKSNREFNRAQLKYLLKFPGQSLGKDLHIKGRKSKMRAEEILEEAAGYDERKKEKKVAKADKNISGYRLSGDQLSSLYHGVSKKTGHEFELNEDIAKREGKKQVKLSEEEMIALSRRIAGQMSQNIKVTSKEVKNDYIPPKFCMYCGEKLDSGAKFCIMCGNVV